MNTKFNKLILVSLVISIAFAGCRKDPDPDPDPVPDPYYETMEFEGSFELSPNDPTSPDDITILSLIDETSLQNDCSFKIVSLENEKYQIFIANSKVSGEATYYGISDPGTGSVLINDSTTALGILLINPLLFSSEQEQRKQYLDQACLSSSFNELVKAIEQARQIDPNDPLNLELHPEIYQLSSELGTATIGKLGDEEESQSKYGEKFIEVIDNPGKEVIFENYRHVFYSADIIYPLAEINDVLLLSRKDKNRVWKWKKRKVWGVWVPGWVKTEPTKTKYEMDDGYVEITYSKFALGTFGDNEDNSKDLATGMNLIYGIFYTIDMLGGPVEKDQSIFMEIYSTLPPSGLELADMTSAILAGDEFKVLEAVVDLLKSGVGMCVLEHMVGNMNDKYKNQLTKGLDKALTAYNWLGYLNEHLPFFWDLVRKPHSLEEQWLCLNGVLKPVKENLPPEASVSFSPSIGFNETQITFTVKDYIDDLTTHPEDALYSWKWMEDEVVDIDDIEWSESSSELEITLTLSSPGRMWLKVDDRCGGEYICCSKKVPFYESVEKTRIIVVSGVKYYQNYLIDSLNFGNGQIGEIVTLSPENFHCECIRSNGQWRLNPATDLLIFHDMIYQVENNQLLVCLNDNGVAISNFVSCGGNFYCIFEANDDIGTIELSNRTFSWELALTELHYRYIKNSLHSNRYFIPEGYTAMLDENAPGITVFTDIPDNAQTHIISEYGEPVLFEINNYPGGTSLFSANSFRCQLKETTVPIILRNTLLYLLGAEFK